MTRLARSRSRPIAGLALGALPLTLLAAVPAAQAASYLPAKNTTYRFVDDEPTFTGEVRIKVGGKKNVLTKVTVKVSCEQGSDQVVFKNLVYKPDLLHFEGAKGPKAKPTYEFFVQFSDKHHGVGDLWLYDGPCDGYLFSFIAED